MTWKPKVAALLVLAGAGGAVQAQETLNFFPQATAAAAAREDERYNEATDALDEGKWQDALGKFASVAEMKGRRADAALYWKAYAQNKLGQRAQAQATITQLRTQHPQSKWLDEAAKLELEVKQAAGQRVRPENTADEELQLLAINSLMDSDEARAIPLLEGVLNSPAKSVRLKDRALFVLAQSDSPKAQQLLANVARGQAYPLLQRKAIQYMGTNDSPANRRSLVEIYNSSQDRAVKRAVLQAFLTSDARDETLRVAKGDPDPELRRAAVQQLGAMGAHNELHQMYQAATSPEEKRHIIHALSISDDVPFIGQIAKTPGDLEVRHAAIHGLGISGAQSRPLLLEIYNGEQNRQIKGAVVEALFINDADDELIALAKRETDPQLKREIIGKLSVMGSRKAKDYMIELLNQ